MKLPLLFKSLFDFEAENPALDAAPEPVAESHPQPHPRVQSVEVEEAIPESEPEPLLDSIDALGKIVLALDAQLRAERSRSAELRSCLNDELSALRTALDR
ncbi:hypothetical protein [Paraburkholderia sp. J76]|uniref:hypothetical protein n=1 Tax=Paraburkholderia sp. J76 TaxID=2805439 RepID=UPI002ABDC2E0|nr:hypothetical protein [Paraburkholderia sp. J76]